MPYWLYGAISLCFGVFLGVAWADEVWRRFQHPWPDFDKWDKKDEFRLWEACCLWVDREPVLPMPRKAKKIFKCMSKDIDSGRLPATSSTIEQAVANACDKVIDGDVRSDPYMIVERQVLEIWAVDGMKQRPKFLYPKERI